VSLHSSRRGRLVTQNDSLSAPRSASLTSFRTRRPRLAGGDRSPTAPASLATRSVRVCLRKRLARQRPQRFLASNGDGSREKRPIERVSVPCPPPSIARGGSLPPSMHRTTNKPVTRDLDGECALQPLPRRQSKKLFVRTYSSRTAQFDAVHTWLILPVVICLSQRLSHAGLSTGRIRRNCEWLIKSVMVP
jgi:hypothetical protein